MRIDVIVNNILVEHREKLAQTKDDNGAVAKQDLVDVLLNIQKRGEFRPELTDACTKAVIFVSEEQTQQFIHFYAKEYCCEYRECQYS